MRRLHSFVVCLLVGAIMIPIGAVGVIETDTETHSLAPGYSLQIIDNITKFLNEIGDLLNQLNRVLQEFSRLFSAEVSASGDD